MVVEEEEEVMAWSTFSRVRRMISKEVSLIVSEAEGDRAME